MKNKIIMLLFLLLPFPVLAQESGESRIFKAEVLEIIEEKSIDQGKGDKIIQQDLGLRGIDGEYKDKNIIFHGIGNLEVISSQHYQPGDKVLMIASKSAEGENSFYITDYIRTDALWWLFAIFLIALFAVGRGKGLRSLIALSLTFLIILKFIIPKIMSGADPLLITVAGSIAIMVIIVYLTEGFGTKGHLAVTSISISLFLTIALSLFFVKFAKLSGASSEDVLFLFNLGDGSINLQGLLLAGIIIGSLGVLDDVIISQIEAVGQLSLADPSQRARDLFSKAYSIGTSHIASMTNTLFLAYAGASLPLLILFVSGSTQFSNLEQVFNTEFIAAEIIRTLAGSIGLILSVPVATAIAAWKFGRHD